MASLLSIAQKFEMSRVILLLMQMYILPLLLLTTGIRILRILRIQDNDVYILIS